MSLARPDSAHASVGRGKTPMSEAFRRAACLASNKLGTHWAFMAVVGLIAGWAVTGPFFHVGETWQLVINTLTTVVTFLMVFLIQATQNRDSKAIHLKLDELIRCTQARNVFADLDGPRKSWRRTSVSSRSSAAASATSWCGVRPTWTSQVAR